VAKFADCISDIKTNVDVHSILQCIYTCAANDVQIVLWERLGILIYIDICITVWVITVEYITMETDVDDIEDEEKLSLRI
jgi:hypothetical protein